MSDSVSFRVVVIWIIVIFFFAGAALFGLMNQDLIKQDNNDDSTFIPDVKTEHSMSCTAYIDRARIIYDFVLGDQNKINNLRIAYNANNGNESDYAFANSIKNLNILGYNSTIQNEYSNFLLLMYLNYENLDKNTLVSNNTYFDNLYMVVSDVTTYNEYYNLLMNKYNNIECKDTSK